MRFTSLTTSLLLLLLPPLASANGPPPSCTLSCIHGSLESTSCPGDKNEMAKRMGEHWGCLCQDEKYMEALYDSIANSGKCKGAAEVQAAKEAVETTCEEKINDL